VEVSVLLTDDRDIAELNLIYRGVDRPTDVLAFPQDETLLGDVVISVETAKRQAEERGKPLDDELDLLVAHGLLHLLGYDDDTPEGLERMNARAAQVLGESVAK